MTPPADQPPRIWLEIGPDGMVTGTVILAHGEQPPAVNPGCTALQLGRPLTPEHQQLVARALTT